MAASNPDKTPISVQELAERVGQEFALSRWFDMPQSRIDAFADAIEDWQFIHINPEAAKATPFGGTIAHGFLTLSMLSAIAYDALPAIDNMAMSVNYGFDKVRFLTPVPAGARIRGHFTLLEFKPRKPMEWQMRKGVEVEIEGLPKPALAAEWLGLVYLKS